MLDDWMCEPFKDALPGRQDTVINVLKQYFSADIIWSFI